MEQGVVRRRRDKESQILQHFVGGQLLDHERKQGTPEKNDGRIGRRNRQHGDGTEAAILSVDMSVCQTHGRTNGYRWCWNMLDDSVLEKFDVLGHKHKKVGSARLR